MAAPQIPRIADILAPGIDKLIELRPRAEQHLAKGRWGDIIAGWSAQAALLVSHLVSEANAARLSLAEGDALRALASSDYWADLETAPTSAVGTASIERVVDNGSSATTGNFGSIGDVPAGARFRRPADPDAVPPREEGIYQATEPVLADDVDTTVSDMGGGVWRHTQILNVPIEAVRPGPHANTPVPPFISGQNSPCEIVSPLFDTRFAPRFLIAGGGSASRIEDQIRAFARAMYLGQHGPVATALVAGALSDPGVRHVGVVLDPTQAIHRVIVTDESWGGSDVFSQRVQRRLVDGGWVGWGSRVGVDFAANIFVRVEASVIIESDAVSAQAEIGAAVRKRLVRYFNERPDWWTWRANTIGGLIGLSDRRILACTSVAVRDANGGGALSEPSATLPYATRPNHYFLVNDQVKLTFSTPS